MEFFHHQTIRKYTASLLDTFNDIYIKRDDKNGNDVYVNVPITFGSKDRAFVFSELDTERWRDGNYNILPRMSLSLISIDADRTRNTNRLHTINKTIDGEIVTFQYNAVAYNFSFELDVATKSLTELSMVLEQILPYFNPTLNINVQELDILNEPTSIKVTINNTTLDLPDTFQMEDNLRIVGAKLSLTLSGNVYMPFKDADIIKQVRLYINAQQDELISSDRHSKLEFEVDQTTKMAKEGTIYKLDFEPPYMYAPSYWYQVTPTGEIVRDSANRPILIENGIHIDGETNVFVGETMPYELKFVDVDDETFTYVWNVLSGNASIYTNNVNPARIIFNGAGNVLLQGQVIDSKGGISPYVTKQIVVTA